MVSMDAFASAFGFDAKSDDVWTTLGKVTAVNGSTLSVLLGGSATPTECEDYCLANVGDIVFVAISKGRARAIAVKGGGAFLKLKPSASELPQDTSTGSGFPIVLSDTFADDGEISYMDASDFMALMGNNAAVESTTTVADIITADTSNVTMVSAQFAKWGKLAMVYLRFTNKNSISVPVGGDTGNITVGVLADGKHPAVQCGLTCDGDETHPYTYIQPSGTVRVGGFDSRGATYTIAAGTNFYVYGTFILA